jgi:hypothetical protein
MRGKATGKAFKPLMSPDTGLPTIHGSIAAGDWRGLL